MAKTVVISVRVPEDVVKKLKRAGKDPRKLVKEFLLRKSLEEEVEKLNEVGKRIVLPKVEEMKKIIEEGRA